MKIEITQVSETVKPEIAWGKNLGTGEWVCSLDFSDERSDRERFIS